MPKFEGIGKHLINSFWFCVGVVMEAPNTKENGARGYLFLIPFVIAGVLVVSKVVWAFF